MSKIKKTFFATLLVAILALSACAADSPANDGDITIGIIQMMEHPALDLIRTSFLEEMTNLGYTNVVFDHRNGTGDMGSLTTISQIFVGNDVDLIVAIATPAAQAAAAATSTIPIVFSGVTDP
ncbi:MAG: peptide ABC transporter substrate-binding protein, partial [Firmicutes bacterium]|nr:peptide ABC transporter substrate-binding protein [Bacillota bacterium]